MVQMDNNNSEFQNKIVPEQESLLKKFDVPIHHLDFKYLENCKDGKQIEKIYQILKSGQEGYYPDLLKYAEKRLFEEYPNSKFLRSAVPILSKKDITKDEWDELSTDIQNWIEDISKNDEELVSFQAIKPCTINIPIRESKLHKNKNHEQKSERIRSMDYESWDKLDVDTEILKMDIKDDKMKEEALKKAKEKEKFQKIELDPDLMTQAELKHAAFQAKNAGNECYKSGDYQEALQYYSNSITFLPSANAYNNRAMTNIKLKRYKTAINDCNEVINLENNNEKAYLRKSTALKCLKQYDKAMETLETLLKIHPNSVDAQNLINVVKKLSGNSSEKVKSIRMKIEEYNENEKKENKVIIEESNEKKESTIICSDKYQMKKKIPKKVSFKEPEDKDVLIPIPSTSKCSGPFYKVLKLPNEVAKKVTNTTKTHFGSDEKVIDLNNPTNYLRKGSLNNSENGLKENINITNKDHNNKNRNKANDNENKINKKSENGSYEKKTQGKENANYNRNKQINISPLIDDIDNIVKEKNNYKKENDKNNTENEINNPTKADGDKNMKYTNDDIPPLMDVDIEKVKSNNNKLGDGDKQNIEKKEEYKNYSPYEFLKRWQAIKCDPTLQEHEKLLRSLNPADLPKVVGNKLDGDMFSLLLQCLETRFVREDDNTFVENVLEEVQKIPRINIIMLLMNDKDKNNIRSIIARIKKDNFYKNTYEMYID